MEKIFTLNEQHQSFNTAQTLFLQGNYKEAEPLFRLVIESAFQHKDYDTYVKAIVFLNRTFVNTSQMDLIQPFLLIISPYVNDYGTKEDYYYYRLHKIILNKHYLLGDAQKEYETLLDEVWDSEYKNLAFLIASNLINCYIETNQIEQGIEIFEKLEQAYANFEFPNKLTLYMHYIYAFLLFYLHGDFEKCQATLQEIKDNPKIHIVESFSYMFDICEGLLQAELGHMDYAKEIFEQGINKVDNLVYIRFEIKLWVQTLKKFNLKDDVIFYQDKLISLLDAHYDSEMSALRKKSLEDRSRQFYEGQIYVDQLTNVKNRNFYENLLAKQQQVKNFTVAVLDIDRFKSINDTYGHTVGDEAIKFIATHLKNWNPHHDISIIRFGGDEFIILMPYPIEENIKELQLLHEKIIHTPFHLKKEQKNIPISISMGVGHTGDNYQRIEQLFEVADSAIYEAKKTRGVMVVSEMDAAAN